MIAIRSRQLIAHPDYKPIANGIVVIDGDAISAVGPPSVLPERFDGKVIDCSRWTVMPGLIDSHSHVNFCGANRFKEQYGPIAKQVDAPLVLRHLRMYRNVLSDMKAGVTTIRSLGTNDDSDLVLRDQINDGLLCGPRILASGIPLRPSHGTAAFLGRPVDGVAEIRKAVREIYAKGADVVKVFATNIQGGQGDVAYRKGDLTATPGYSLDELRAACDEAHQAGLKLAAHAIGGPAMRWAMEAGADSVEHANMLEQADIEVFLKTGCVLSDPNLYLFFDPEYGFSSRNAWNELPAWWQHKVHVAEKLTRDNQRLAYQAGVPFALALDSGHGLIWREAACMVDVLGASPQDAIRSLTTVSARLCGLEHAGSLEPGKVADIIAVDGDPLEDVRALRDVKFVMKAGTCYDALLEHAMAFDDENQLLRQRFIY